MATITHPSMKRAVDTSIKPKQTFVVDDESQNLEQHLEQFEERPLMPPVEVIEQAKLPPKIVLSPEQQEKRRRLEDLIFTGRQAKVVEIFGRNFELSTLTSKEHQLMIKELYNIGDNVDLFRVRTLTLANALKTIDGVRLDDLVEENTINRRAELIDSLQLALIEKLYEEYNKLTKENDALLSGDALKK